MFVDSKYSKVLTVLLIIVIIGIVGLLAFLGYSMYTKYFLDADTQAFMDEYTNSLGIQPLEGNNITGDFNSLLDVNAVTNASGDGAQETKKFKECNIGISSVCSSNDHGYIKCISCNSLVF